MVLYESDTAQHQAGVVLQRHFQEDAELSDEVRAYTSELVSGVVKDLEALDAVLHDCAPDFPLAQVAAIDRNILRIALFEMKSGLTPPKVAINEAIEISKEYGSESTPRFVNGVLGTATPKVVAGP